MPDLGLFPHQLALFSAPWNPQAAGHDYFFLTAGYGSGKTFADVGLLLNLIRRYATHDVTIGIGAVNREFLRKTMLLDFYRMMNRHGIAFDEDKTGGIITVGRMRFMLLGVEDARRTMFGFNVSAFICDELPPQKAAEAAQAISERTRIPFPDGRMPFQVYTNTAQGYLGLYQLIESLKEQGIKRVMIRAETRMNPLFPKEVYDRLFAQYSELERDAFLFGRIVNLKTGRVYYGYDEDRNRLKARPFEPNAADRVRVGQDLNAGYSRGVAIVKRPWPGPDGVLRPTLFVCRAWSFAQIGHAPSIMRNDFPSQAIDWYPDASAKEILAGYTAEVRGAGINLYFSSVNPSIVDRVLVTNKLAEAGQLLLFPGPETRDLSMALRMRQYNEAGEPVKRQGEGDPSHFCDSLEYVLWRIVCWDPDFRHFFELTRSSRMEAKGNLAPQIVSPGEPVPVRPPRAVYPHRRVLQYRNGRRYLV